MPMSTFFGLQYASGPDSKTDHGYHATQEFFQQKFGFESFEHVMTFLHDSGVVDYLGSKRIVNRASLIRNFNITPVRGLRREPKTRIFP